MYFTQEDYRKIEEYLKHSGKKDTDFEALSKEDLLKGDIFTVVHDNKNYKISLELLALYINQGQPQPVVDFAFSVSPKSIPVGSLDVQATLTATSNVEAHIELYDDLDNLLTLADNTSLTYQYSFTPSSAGTKRFKAMFQVDSTTLTLEDTISIVTPTLPIYYGWGEDWLTMSKKTRDTLKGTYTFNVGTAESYVFFLVPSDQSITKATLMGFDFPLEQPQNITYEGNNYKMYQSSNTYDAYTFNIEIQ